MCCNLFRRISRSEDGSSLVYTLLALPVMVGAMGIALDLTNQMSMQTELQDLVDAAAIAGAYELDGTDAGIAAATAAARSALANGPLIPTDEPSTFDIQTPRYFSTLANAIAGTNPWTTGGDPDDAIFIRVDAEPRSVVATAVRALPGIGDNFMTAGAAAIASSYVAACNVQPLMLCNPLETTTSAPEFDPTPGQLFVFNPKGTSPGFAPGDFGLVDPPEMDSSGAPEIKELLSQQGRDVCYANRVNPRTGHATNQVSWGINTRFDRPPGGCAGPKCSIDASAAPHVIDGYKPKNSSCNQFDLVDPVATNITYPRDTSFESIGTLRLGNGIIDEEAKKKYWEYHHGTSSSWPKDASGKKDATRYEAYLVELEMMKNSNWGKSPPPENPAPQCLATSPAGADRRVISAAIVNCLEWGVRGNSVNNVRSEAYAEFFLTEPAGDGKEGGEIFAEFIRKIEPDDSDGKLRRIVQLYR